MCTTTGRCGYIAYAQKSQRIGDAHRHKIHALSCRISRRYPSFKCSATYYIDSYELWCLSAINTYDMVQQNLPNENVFWRQRAENSAIFVELVGRVYRAS